MPEAVGVLGTSFGEARQDFRRKKASIEAGQSCVPVTHAAPDSPAAEPGMAVGEIVTEIAAEQVKTREDVANSGWVLHYRGRTNLTAHFVLHDRRASFCHDPDGLTGS